MTGQKAAANAISDTLKLLERQGLSRESMVLLVAKLLEIRNPDKTIRVPRDAEIEMVAADGVATTIFLSNLLVECERDSEKRVEVVERYLKDLSAEPIEEVAARREDVVALVRDSVYRSFVAELDEGEMTKHLTGDFWVIYALDRSDSTTVMTTQEMIKLGISRDEIASLSQANLARFLNDLEIVEHGGWFSLTSENSVYLAGALLLDKVWINAASMVDGDVIVAAPARDTVIFTGASSPEGLRMVREQAEYVVRNGDHVLSATLLQRAGQTWKLFL